MRFLPFLAAASLLPSAAALGQSEAGPQDGRVEILNADVWEFDRLKNGAQLLKGNVRFKHAGAIMLCDSAHLYEDQRVDAFGHVSIHQGDTLHADAERLRYDGKERMAHMEGDVRLRDRDMELITPALDYDLRNRRAVYTQGGTITSRSENNVLTSGAGPYLTDQRRFVFSRNVRLDHPQHRIVSDTMHYVTSTGVSEFFGPTTITQGGTVIRTLRGAYDTRTERARFTRRSSVQSKGFAVAYGDVPADDRLMRPYNRGMSTQAPPRIKAPGPGDHVILVDGSSFVFRAYFQSIRQDQRYNYRSDRLPTGAVRIFATKLVQFIREGARGRKATHLAMIFDKSEDSFRKALYPAYKANRSDPPEDLIPQFPLMRAVVRAFGYEPVEMAKYEADDLIATYAGEAARGCARCHSRRRRHMPQHLACRRRQD